MTWFDVPEPDDPEPDEAAADGVEAGAATSVLDDEVSADGA
jgi:hypothetical protein